MRHLCLLLTLECLLSPLSTLPEALMDHVSGGSWVSRLPPQQLNSYLYWYVQKLQEKKK